MLQGEIKLLQIYVNLTSMWFLVDCVRKLSPCRQIQRRSTTRPHFPWMWRWEILHTNRTSPLSRRVGSMRSASTPTQRIRSMSWGQWTMMYWRNLLWIPTTCATTKSSSSRKKMASSKYTKSPELPNPWSAARRLPPPATLRPYLSRNSRVAGYGRGSCQSSHQKLKECEMKLRPRIMSSSRSNCCFITKFQYKREVVLMWFVNWEGRNISGVCNRTWI